MDRLRQLLTTITTQLSVLTVSQRVAIGLCAALIAGSLLWLLQWSTTPDLVPLLTHKFTYEELDSAEESLRANNLKFEIQGSRVYVRSADRHNALRILHAADALPDGSLFDMESVVTDPNPFISPEARKTAETYAKGNELAKIISTYPFVKRASVMLNEKTRRRIGSPSDVPTASVVVALSGSTEMSAEIVEGFAKLVSGAVAGLEPHNVYVTDARTGRSFQTPHPDDVFKNDYLGIVKSRETHLLKKIMSRLAYIPGIRAQVSVELDARKSVKHTNTYDDPQPKTEGSETSATSAGGGPSESGVQANLGQAVTMGGTGRSDTTEKSTVENFPPNLRETETIEQLPFTTKRVTATVSIPRSFVVGVYAASHPDQPDPKDDDPAFVAVRTQQIERVARSVERIVMATDSSDVEVDVYPDMDWSAEGIAWSRSPGGAVVDGGSGEELDTAAMLRVYGPQVGLGFLALISVMMMTRMARKSAEAMPKSAASDLQAQADLEHEQILSVGSRSVGQAEMSESMLTAKEVDEKTLKYDELTEEVSKMVRDDPEVASGLLRRWIEQD